MKMSVKTFLIVAVVFLFAVSAFAALQTSQETAKDPACNMAVKKAGAKFTAEYQGKKYYFCSETCKEAFLKDPAKFLAEAESAQAGDVKDQKSVWPCCRRWHATMKGMMDDCPMMLRHVAMMHRMAEGCGRMGRGMACLCPMCCGPAANMNVSVENTADGVVVKISSKDADTVKMIQERCVKMKEAWTSCPKSKTEVVEKESPDKK